MLDQTTQTFDAAAEVAEDAKIIKEVRQDDSVDWMIVYEHRLSVLSSLKAARKSAGELSARLGEGFEQFLNVLDVFQVTAIQARIYTIAMRQGNLKQVLPARAGRAIMALSEIRQQMLNKAQASCEQISDIRDQLAPLRSALTRHSKAVDKIKKHPEKSSAIDHEQLETDVRQWEDFAHGQAEFMMSTMSTHMALAGVLNSLVAPLSQQLSVDLADLTQAISEGAPAVYKAVMDVTSDSQHADAKKWVLSDSQLDKVQALLNITPATA